MKELILRKIYTYYRIKGQPMKRREPLQVGIVKVSFYKIKVFRLLKLISKFRKKKQDIQYTKQEVQDSLYVVKLRRVQDLSNILKALGFVVKKKDK